jgi:hypothetical protein
MTKYKREQVITKLENDCNETLYKLINYKGNLQKLLSEISYDAELVTMYLKYNKKNDTYIEMLLLETIAFFEFIRLNEITNFSHLEWVFMINIVDNQVKLTSHWANCIIAEYITDNDIKIEALYKNSLEYAIKIYDSCNNDSKNII